jgi:hypothetical protein
MACRSGFGSCLCFDNSWTFRVTFQFPKNVLKYDIATPLGIVDTLNARAGGETIRENVTKDGMLKEETLLHFGIPFAGKYFMLTTAEITRPFLPGDIVSITRFERTGVDWPEVFRRRHAAYPVPAGLMQDPAWQDRNVVRPEFFFDIIIPPAKGASKVGGHMGGYHAEQRTNHRIVLQHEYPAVFDPSAAGVAPYQTTGRHIRVNSAVQGPYQVDNWGVTARAEGETVQSKYPMIVLGMQYGPVRWDRVLDGPSHPLDLYPPTNGPLWGSFYCDLSSAQVTSHKMFDGYGYYFKEDYIYHAGAPYIQPGMDWFASQYWSDQTITIEGRVTR